MFFIAGGLLYLYREEIKNSSKAFRVIDGAVLVGSVIAYYTVAPSIFTILITFFTLTILAIFAGGTAKLIFQNNAVRFISSISMEAYLCHMFVFRLFERLLLKRLSLPAPLQYWLTAVVVIIGAIIMAWICQTMLNMLQKKIYHK